MISAIAKEIFIRKNYLAQPVQSIYFGGGTPSLVSAENISYILTSLRQFYAITDEVEITLEANPDDISLRKITAMESYRNQQAKFRNTIVLRRTFSDNEPGTQ